MEEKKYPKADLSKRTGLFFNIGLVVTLLLCIFAFNYKFYDEGKTVDLGSVKDNFEDVMEIPPTQQPPPPPPKIQQPKIIEVPDEEEIQEDVDLNLDIDMTEDTKVEDVVINAEPEEEKADQIFTIVEEQAQPKGGLQAFYKYVGEQLADKYPRQAQRMGIEGVVYVQFVIEKDGSLTDVKAIKGIGGGCDEVAEEVVKNAPAWSPGKQRGRAVRSRRVIPIRFVLN